MGKYHGIEGFRTLSHPKGSLRAGSLEQHTPSAGPFGKRADALLNLFLR
jgi:coniferyl-aldehyde dehydrogenase